MLEKLKYIAFAVKMRKAFQKAGEIELEICKEELNKEIQRRQKIKAGKKRC